LKKRILLFGGTGLIGSTFINYSQDLFEIFYTKNTNNINFEKTKSYQIDLLTENNRISSIINNSKPDIIIHTAAYPSVDFCEINHELADELHVNATKTIVDCAIKNNSKVIFLSTDGVFEGELNKKYNENDIPKPINYYGKTKLNAEKIVLEKSDNVVLRTAVVYGWHVKSRFTNWILDYLRQNKVVDPFIDQFNTPTLVDDLAKSMIKIIENNIAGLFHATGKTCLNRYEFAVKLANSFGHDKKLILPVTSNEKKQGAPRPSSTCLDSSKLEKTINFQFSDIEKGISFILDKSRGL